MKIIREIRELHRLVRSITPVKGKGVVVERTPTGTVLSVEPSPATTEAEAEEPTIRGMFQIETANEEDGEGQYVVVHDTSPAAEREDGEDEDSPPKYAGEVYVNNVLRGNALAFSYHPLAAGLYYIYLHFNAAAGEDGGESGESGDNEQGEVEEPASQVLELVCTATQQSSDGMNVYCLIGRVRFSSQEKEIDGETTTVFTVSAITQDHTPLGPVHLTWETGGGGPTGPFDSRLWKDAATGQWYLECYNSNPSSNMSVSPYAGAVYCGNELHTFSRQRFAVSAPGWLFVVVEYDTANGYSFTLNYSNTITDGGSNDRRFICELAYVFQTANGYSRVLSRGPGNIQIYGRWF